MPEMSSTSKNKEKEDAMKWVPPMLRPYIQHFYADYYVSPMFDPSLIQLLMVAGFLPIATKEDDRYYLLPKLHLQRCIVSLDKVHISKNSKRQSTRYTFRINTAFQQVVDGCHAQHGIPWLYPPMVQCLAVLHQRGFVYSIEVWKEGTMVAGELGYVVGSMYTSLTGFSNESGAGTVQLATLASFLWKYGYKIWDLGMVMEYKTRMGAYCLSRPNFLQLLDECRRHTNPRPRSFHEWEEQTCRHWIHLYSNRPSPDSSVP